MDSLVSEALASVAIAPRVAAVCCLHQLAQLVRVANLKLFDAPTFHCCRP